MLTAKIQVSGLGIHDFKLHFGLVSFSYWLLVNC